MVGAVTINGTDIATLGALMLRGGDNGFISFPKRKEPVMIEWPDQHGFEISDDAPVFEAKKFTVNYYLKGDETTFNTRLNAFADLHFTTANLAIYVREFDFTFNVRFAGISAIKISRGFTTSGEKNARISVDYIQDNPVQFFSPGITEPTAYREPDTKVEISEIDLAAFGIIVKDVYSTAFRLTPKPGIIYNSRYGSGEDVTYPAVAKREKQTLAIACAMICADRDEFIANYNALWNLVAVAELEIALTAAGKTFSGYFSGMEGFTKRPWTKRAFAEFELNFVGYEV